MGRTGLEDLGDSVHAGNKGEKHNSINGSEPDTTQQNLKYTSYLIKYHNVVNIVDAWEDSKYDDKYYRNAGRCVQHPRVEMHDSSVES